MCGEQVLQETVWLGMIKVAIADRVGGRAGDEVHISYQDNDGRALKRPLKGIVDELCEKPLGLAAWGVGCTRDVCVSGAVDADYSEKIPVGVVGGERHQANEDSATEIVLSRRKISMNFISQGVRQERDT
jgi:hypothetical protein